MTLLVFNSPAVVTTEPLANISMKTTLIIAITILILSFESLCQTKETISINENLDSISRTIVCTDFQIFHCINKCDASLNNDTLIIELNQQNVSTFDELRIKISKREFKPTYRTVYIAMDLEGKNEWIPIECKLILNNETFSKQKEIKGLLNFKFQEVYITKSGKISNTRIIDFKGQFETIIE